VDPGLDGLEPLRRAHLQLDLGRIRTMTADYPDAERLLLAAHGAFADGFGGGYDLTRQSVTELITMYDAWAKAGSAAAVTAAREWRARRS
ncbi:MAG: hypothetical protein IH621_13535, partial [Krumholzibacteria bacterium]|nr:hypothetical protein [Candidatus Krumholzibacteria bacterium]